MKITIKTQEEFNQIKEIKKESQKIIYNDGTEYIENENKRNI